MKRTVQTFRPVRWSAGVGAGLVVVLSLSACGSGQSPASGVPAVLRSDVAAVIRAAAAGELAAATGTLDLLRSDVARELAAQHLTAAGAAAILRAAARVEADLTPPSPGPGRSPGRASTGLTAGTTPASSSMPSRPGTARRSR